MWWLSFLNGSVVIITASSLVHARLLAARQGLGRASHFVNGHFVDPGRVRLPSEYIGRVLSPIEARQLDELLPHGPETYDADHDRESASPSSRRQD